MGLATELLERGIELLVEDGNLVVESLTPLTDEQRDFLRKHKADLLVELTQQKAANDEGPILYCAADLGLPMLPGNPGDAEFINGLLTYCSPEWRHTLLTEYKAQWLAAAGAPELKEHQRDNAGRFAANTWLRTQLH